MTVVFVLGSHVRHVGVFIRRRDGGWGPLCRQVRPSNDANDLPWRIASTPRQHERPVCTRCAVEARKITEAI